MSKRSIFYNFYKNKKQSPPSLLGLFQPTPGQQLRRNAAELLTQEKYKFKGEETVIGAVVRVDLNDYSKWAKEKQLSARRELLSDFFTRAVGFLENNDGIYLRDEGDCLVALFSDYFTGGSFDPQKIETFCMNVVSNTYGSDDLSAKATVAIGDISIYQKEHESEDDEWSAEGEPFVKVSRLEHSIESKTPNIYYFQEDYDDHFRNLQVSPSPGQPYYWEINAENIQVSGIGLPNGWAKIVRLEHIPDGRY